MGGKLEIQKTIQKWPARRMSLGLLLQAPLAAGNPRVLFPCGGSLNHLDPKVVEEVVEKLGKQ